jgi:hypothetical protein
LIGNFCIGFGVLLVTGLATFLGDANGDGVGEGEELMEGDENCFGNGGLPLGEENGVLFDVTFNLIFPFVFGIVLVLLVVDNLFVPFCDNNFGDDFVSECSVNVSKPSLTLFIKFKNDIFVQDRNCINEMVSAIFNQSCI